MLDDNFNVNAGRNTLPPQPAVEGYDIHIYFKPGESSEKAAQEIVRNLRTLFPDSVNDVHNVGIVGPHLSPNYGVDIKPESFGKVVSWLQLNSSGLSILVHPRTGDELRDHLELPLWLGKQLELNPAYFAQLKKNDQKGPSLQ